MFADLQLFSSLDRIEPEALSAHAVTRTYRKNTIVINVGDAGDSMYMVQSGQLKVFLSDDEGKEIVINVMGPGEYFGELSLFDITGDHSSHHQGTYQQVAAIDRECSQPDTDGCLRPGRALAAANGRRGGR